VRIEMQIEQVSFIEILGLPTTSACYALLEYHVLEWAQSKVRG
jgi:uncharacterized membrane protein YccF (DUF307 family)